jgi:hypothetical protein
MPDYHRILKLVDELRARLVELVEADEQPPPEPPKPSAPKNKARWTGPVSPAIREERQRKHDWRFRLCVELNRDPFLRTFADRRNLSVSEVSRHLTDKPRGVPPGSGTDLAITAALDREIAELESLLSKRLGPEFISKLREGMSADNMRHGRIHRRAAAGRASVQRQTPRQSRRVAGQ